MDKELFYDQLQETMGDISRHDLVLLMGDFNTKIGRHQQGYEHAIGPHATAHITNDNGHMLISFCSVNGLIVGNNKFDHNRIHKKQDGQTRWTNIK